MDQINEKGITVQQEEEAYYKLLIIKPQNPKGLKLPEAEIV